MVIITAMIINTAMIHSSGVNVNLPFVGTEGYVGFQTSLGLTESDRAFGASLRPVLADTYATDRWSFGLQLKL
jgi:hypothetical protein